MGGSNVRDVMRGPAGVFGSLLMLLLASCAPEPPGAPGGSVSESGEPPRSRAACACVRAAGILIADVQTVVAARSDGYIADHLPAPGVVVEPGEILFRVERSALTDAARATRYRAREAGLDRERQLAELRRATQRLHELETLDGFVAASEIRGARSEVEIRRASLDASRAVYDAALDDRRSRVRDSAALTHRADRGALVLDVRVNEGAPVAEGDPVLVLGHPTRRRIRFAVFEADADLLVEQRELTWRRGEHVGSAWLETISASVDPVLGMFVAEAVLIGDSDHAHIAPGASVEISVSGCPSKSSLRPCGVPSNVAP